MSSPLCSPRRCGQEDNRERGRRCIRLEDVGRWVQPGRLHTREHERQQPCSELSLVVQGEHHRRQWGVPDRLRFRRAPGHHKDVNSVPQGGREHPCAKRVRGRRISQLDRVQRHDERVPELPPQYPRHLGHQALPR